MDKVTPSRIECYAIHLVLCPKSTLITLFHRDGVISISQKFFLRDLLKLYHSPIVHTHHIILPGVFRPILIQQSILRDIIDTIRPSIIP